MTQNNIHSSLAVFDYSNHKLCDLYDSQNDLEGQAYKISFKLNMKDGIKSLSFSIPYMIENEKNFRWKYLKSEYLIRLIYNGTTEWYIAQKPEKHKTKGELYGEVTCAGTEASLKTKNIYMEFDDENGIGTVSELADNVLAGTGWHRGYTDPMLEEDGVTEKIRSLTSGGKQGALGLMTTLCNLFKCYPIYKTDSKTVELYNYNNREQVLEGTIGVNLNALNVTYNSSDITTRLYVEGEYAEDGYIGIDDVNPTGMPYIMNFDYYREIGVFTETHEAALATYLTDIKNVSQRIKANSAHITEKEDQINDLIGQCKMVLYYTTQGFNNPVAEYGDLTATQRTLRIGDEVVVLKNNGTFRYATIETTPAALIKSGEYGIAKFATKAAGSIGAYEVQVEAKEKEIANLERKKNATTKADKIAEYNREIANLQSEINTIYTQTNGLYAQMNSLMNSNGLLMDLNEYRSIEIVLQDEQDEIEADFIVAMGDMLRDGYWNNQNYIQGQEQHMYDDAVERLRVMSRPRVTYNFDLVRLHKAYGIPLEEFKLNALFRVHDDELEIHDNLFITSITIGVDEEDAGTIEVTNEDITISSNDLSSLLSRMSQLSDLIEQKNTLYDRAQAISKNKTLYVDRLNGQIDVLKNQILSSVSNWYTDDNGNILFLSADGGSAMMLSGAGFMIANSKDDQGEWLWRTFGSGEGFTADEIVAGFISADRIEAGSIATSKIGVDDNNFGSSLVITGNPSITSLNNQISSEFVVNQPYVKGDLVTHNGVLYVFNSDFAGGTFAQAASHLSETSISTQIELMPDQIIQEVRKMAFTKTFVQLTDPADDPDNLVGDGDYWIQANPDNGEDAMTWGNVKGTSPNWNTWGTISDYNWGVMLGYTKMYVRSDDAWLLVYDRSFEPMMYTRITQTEEKIELEAVRAIRAEEELSARITLTADAIAAEVQRARGEEERIVAKLELTADGKISLTSTNFSHLGQTGSGIYITPTSVDINSSGTFTVKSGGSMTLNSGSSMTINSGGNLTISSGGNFSLTSTNFTVTTSGQITAKSGKIGDWNITTGQLYASSGSTKVVLDSSTTYYPLPGGTTNTNMYAFWCGADAPNTAPFSVTKDGVATIKKLRVQTGANTYQDIDFSNFITSEDLADYDFSSAMGKLKFQTVKSIGVDGNQLKIVTTNGTGGGSKTTTFNG